MKLMRLAICVAVFAVIGGIAISEDLDVRALQAKLAAQEARLNDLQAKMNAKGGAADAEGVISIRKNAVVTIGGTLNTRYFNARGNTKTSLNMLPALDADKNPVPGGFDINDPTTHYRPDGRRGKVQSYKIGDFKVSDARLRFKIDVNDYFDAFLDVNLHDQDTTRSANAQKYFIRWKNVCNSGFGLLVGRNDFVFGDYNPAGIRSGMHGGSDDIAYFNDAFNFMGDNIQSIGAQAAGEGMFVGSGRWLAHHTGWDHNRTTQINPYWETQDGKFKIEASFFQGLDRMGGTSSGLVAVNKAGGVREFRSFDHSPASMSARVTWQPIEGLKLVASAVNFHTNVDYDGIQGFRGNTTGITYGSFNHGDFSSNNTAVFLGFRYRPCFFPKLNTWARWTHGWNEGWVKDMDADSVNFGFSFNFTERLMFFAQGDLLRVKNDRLGNIWYKNNAWASYVGLDYRLPYGVNVQVGWRHEESKFKSRAGVTHTKVKGDIIYGQLGFDF